MPLPTVISDISPVVGTGAAPNAGQPGGGENPSTFDDYLRLYAAFIAQLRAGGGLAASGANRVPFFDAAGALTSAADFARDGSGIVLVGATSTNLASGGLYLAPGFAAEIGVGHGSAAGNSATFMSFRYTNTPIGGITQSGTTGVNYNTTSDARLKRNIVDAPDAGAVIDSIKVRSFDWRSDHSHQRYGMVAQELAQVAPEAVHSPSDPDDMMAVDYSKLVPMLIKEVQSLRVRVAALEA